jgi:hypothetical protein
MSIGREHFRRMCGTSFHRAVRTSFLLAVFTEFLFATSAFGQRPCQSLGGSWTDSSGDVWNLSQDPNTNAITGSYTAFCTTWPITSGSMNPANGQFSITASGGGCTDSAITFSGTIGNSSGL